MYENKYKYIFTTPKRSYHMVVRFPCDERELAI